jgi:transcriptional regulator with XRE-family HTH domain
MAASRSELTLPIPVKRTLRKLGNDIKDARRRRRIATQLMAERASISRTTLNKIEQGHPGVALGHYAMVLFILGLADRLTDLVDIQYDPVGKILTEEFLPKRIRKTRSKDFG